jgi:hypothetical protein
LLRPAQQARPQHKACRTKAWFRRSDFGLGRDLLEHCRDGGDLLALGAQQHGTGIFEFVSYPRWLGHDIYVEKRLALTAKTPGIPNRQMGDAGTFVDDLVCPPFHGFVVWSDTCSSIRLEFEHCMSPFGAGVPHGALADRI